MKEYRIGKREILLVLWRKESPKRSRLWEVAVLALIVMTWLLIWVVL